MRVAGVPLSRFSLSKEFQYAPEAGCEEKYEGEFWDTAGADAMNPLRRVAFKDADITMIAFDMTRESSLDHVYAPGADHSWYNEVQEHGNRHTGR